RSYDGREIVVGIRPEDLHGPDEPPHGASRLRGVVRLREPLGSEVVLHVAVEARAAVTPDVRELASDIGEEETDALRAHEETTTIVARLNPHTAARVGDRLELAVDESALHAFDPATGLSIREGG